jgi:hypothetical protein
MEQLYHNAQPYTVFLIKLINRTKEKKKVKFSMCTIKVEI